MSFFHKLSLMVFFSVLLININVEASKTPAVSERTPAHAAHSNAKLRKTKSKSIKSTSPAIKSAAVKPTPQKTTTPVTTPKCQPYTEHFTNAVGTGASPWTSLSSRSDSIKMMKGGGVELTLQPPAGKVTVSKDGTTNDKLGDGATINSTFALLLSLNFLQVWLPLINIKPQLNLLHPTPNPPPFFCIFGSYGKVTFSLQASSVPGTVTAAVLIGTKTDDEIDVEILGGDPTHWQTNVFHSAPGETTPLYGVFGGVHGYSGNGRVDAFHTYVVDWSPTRVRVQDIDSLKVDCLRAKSWLKKCWHLFSLFFFSDWVVRRWSSSAYTNSSSNPSQWTTALPIRTISHPGKFLDDRIMRSRIFTLMINLSCCCGLDWYLGC